MEKASVGFAGEGRFSYQTLPKDIWRL